jgi:glycosyltransferase involved in cell wall biosynthesis
MELFNASCSDVVFTVTQDEKEFLLKEDASLNVEVMPNIHEVIHNVKPFDKRKDIMFIGGFLHQPNEDAVFYFVDEIFPLVKEKIPDMTFYVVGSDPSEKLLKLNSRDVKVTGYVPDVMPYFEDCRVFISPLRYGAGMKGKIGQSMGYGLPVVTTTIGAEGIGLTQEQNALIADGRQDFAEAVVKLYTDELLWEKLSRESIALIDKNYSKEIIREKLREVFEVKRQLQEA